MKNQDQGESGQDLATERAESPLAALGSRPLGQTSMRELLCHYLARVYEAGHRDTSYEQGETLDEVLRQINQVLGFAGYELESKERAALLAGEYPWLLPDTSIERCALEWVHDPDTWNEYQFVKEHDPSTAAASPEWLRLCEAVIAKYGEPVVMEDVP